MADKKIYSYRSLYDSIVKHWNIIYKMIPLITIIVSSVVIYGKLPKNVTTNHENIEKLKTETKKIKDKLFIVENKYDNIRQKMKSFRREVRLSFIAARKGNIELVNELLSNTYDRINRINKLQIPNKKQKERTEKESLFNSLIFWE